MKTKQYRYPPLIQNFKTLSKFVALLFLLVVITGIVTYDSANHDDKVGYYWLLFGLFMIIFWEIFYLGDYPDVKVDNDGLYVEFLWTYLPVPWEDIVEIKHFKFLFLEWWLVITKKNLTFFHRIYSIYSLKSLLPGFLIHHKESQDHADLLKLIRNFKSNTIRNL